MHSDSQKLIEIQLVVFFWASRWSQMRLVVFVNRNLCTVIQICESHSWLKCAVAHFFATSRNYLHLWRVWDLEIIMFNTLILGPTRSLQWKGDLLEWRFHPHLVGGIIENICSIPNPAIPPYDVRTLHIRGIWTTEANNPTTGVITVCLYICMHIYSYMWHLEHTKL